MTAVTEPPDSVSKDTALLEATVWLTSDHSENVLTVSLLLPSLPQTVARPTVLKQTWSRRFTASKSLGVPGPHG